MFTSFNVFVQCLISLPGKQTVLSCDELGKVLQLVLS